MKTIRVNIPNHEYDIILERGCITNLQTHIDTSRKIFILTDTNIPDKWIRIVQTQCTNSMVYKVKAGEQAKSFATYEKVLQQLSQFHMSRKDLVIALGGGVIGDLAGFVSATYMRGIDFVSIPTTTLSQIDSSIGGKTAINLGKVKNIVGSFHHPKAVFIDFDTLSTLEDRHVKSGLIEAIKAGLIYDPKLFALFEEDASKHLEEIIYRSLLVKKDVVEKDEKESSLRKILNFGHTIGHGIEAYYNLETYYHGECVAMGMLYFTNKKIAQKLRKLYAEMNIPLDTSFDIEEVYQLCTLDKKAFSNQVSVVVVEEIGTAKIMDVPMISLKTIIERGTYEE